MTHEPTDAQLLEFIEEDWFHTSSYEITGGKKVWAFSFNEEWRTPPVDATTGTFRDSLVAAYKEHHKR